MKCLLRLIIESCNLFAIAYICLYGAIYAIGLLFNLKCSICKQLKLSVMECFASK